MSLSLHDKIRRLEAYNNSPSPIITVYFQLPKSRENLSVVFHTLINAHVSEEQKKQLLDNIEYINGFLQEYQRKKNDQTLVFFSGGNNLFEVIHMPYSMENHVTVSHSPDLLPLLQELTDYRRYLAIFFDKKRAFFFTIIDGVMEDKKEISYKDVPQNVHENAEEIMHNQREDKINRHIQQHLDEHFGKIAKDVEQFVHNRPIIGVILGGHKNLMHTFISHLPIWMRKRIIEEITSELNVDQNTLITEANTAIEKANEKFNNERNAYTLR